MVKLITQLKVGQRFAVLGMIALLLASLPTALFVREAWQTLQARKHEAQGIVPSKAILKVIQLTQQHRGMTAVVLSGEAAMEPKRAAKQQEAEQAFQTLSGIVSTQLHTSAARDAWQTALKNWVSLSSKVASGSVSKAESFSEHTSLVVQLLKTMDLFSDEFGLARDPAPDANQLIQAVLYALPDLTEELGKARARGAGMLTSKAPTPAERQSLGLYVSKANDSLARMVRAFDKAAAANPELKSDLAATMSEATDLAQQATRLATEQILNTEQFSYAASAYFDFFTKAIDAQLRFNQAAMSSLDAMLEGTASRRQRELLILLGSLGLMVLVGASVGVIAARSITTQLGGEPGEVVRIADAIAQSDLSSAISVKTGTEASIVAAMARMQDSLQKVVSAVRQSSESIASGSTEIASGNADLSQRTEEQAANLEETAASMEQLTATVKQNSETARQAKLLASSASEAAAKGGAVVGQVVGTMGEITTSSKKIADIISVIDGIAFQTNILALNAAVEAARAGEQGRGFAVVASEVRSLAQRSAQAAKEIKTLIDASVDKVEIGARQVADAGQSMDDIVNQVQQVSKLITEISSASEEQTQGIAQVGEAVQQLDQVTQQNAALVEQSAATAETLKHQAAGLNQVVSVFRLRKS